MTEEEKEQFVQDRLKPVNDFMEEASESAAHMVSRAVDEGKPRLLDRHKELASTGLGRIAIQAEFEKRGIRTPGIYVAAVLKSYKEGMVTSDRPDIDLKNRRHVTNSIETVEGLGRAEKDRSGVKTLIIEFHEAFSKDNDGAKVKIGVRPAPGSDPNNPGSSPQQVPDCNLRDPEWEDPPGDGDSEVLGSETG